MQQIMWRIQRVITLAFPWSELVLSKKSYPISFIHKKIKQNSARDGKIKSELLK